MPGSQARLTLLPTLTVAGWIAVFPRLAILFTVLGINFLGDGLRDLLDPRLRRQT